MDSLDEILQFWFGGSEDDRQVIREKRSLWFDKDNRVDEEIRRRFLPLLTDSGEKQRRALPEEAPADRHLALIILYDQLTRNMFRNQARAFAYDRDALDIARQGVKQGWDRELRPVQRVFVYLPFEHSEDRQDQARSVELFERLLGEIPESWQQAFAGFYDYALRHQEIIDRFGRFPHRNAILGRPSTPEEVEFLKQPNSSF